MKKFLEFFKTHRIFTTLLWILLISIVLFVLLNMWLHIYTRHNQTTTLPSVKYLTVEEAAQVLSRNDLTYEIIDSVFNEKAKPGIVLEQIPEPETHVKQQRVVYLTINAFSPKTIKFPSIINSSIRQAETQIRSLGFTNIIIREKESPYKGLVLDAQYNGRSIKSGEKIPAAGIITLYIGKGEEPEEELL